MNFRSNQPFVGTSAFAHKGGMHVHAVNRVTQSYEHIDPETVGNERRILVSELSGQSNILAKTTKYQLQQRQRADDEDPRPRAGPGKRGLRVRGGRGVVRPAGQEGRRHCISRSSSGSTTASTSRPATAASPLTEATVKLTRRRPGRAHRQRRATARSTPSTRRLRKALLPAYPRLAEMHLVDYKVRVVNSSEGTAARVRVVIESRDGERRLEHRRRQREHHRSKLAGVGDAWYKLWKYKLFKDRRRHERWLESAQTSWRRDAADLNKRSAASAISSRTSVASARSSQATVTVGPRASTASLDDPRRRPRNDNPHSERRADRQFPRDPTDRPMPTELPKQYDPKDAQPRWLASGTSAAISTPTRIPTRSRTPSSSRRRT